jgi:16S rRNA (guanine966-N2)-methyltransferase
VTRIIGGVAGGRRLVGRVRPPRGTTSDRAREALFAAVLATLGSLDGAAVLDLYAGSGAVGLEALSRGASRAVLVESDARAVQVIKKNVAAVGLPGAVIICDRVDRTLRRGPEQVPPCQFAFADPPYATSEDEVAEVLQMLAGLGWLASAALVVVERDASSGPPPWPPGYASDRSRRYGETTLWYGRASGGSSSAATTGA